MPSPAPTAAVRRNPLKRLTTAVSEPFGRWSGGEEGAEQGASSSLRRLEQGFTAGADEVGRRETPATDEHAELPARHAPECFVFPPVVLKMILMARIRSLWGPAIG